MSTENWAEEIGKPAYESIVEMVAALECNYDRLEELRDERDDWDPEDNDGKTWADANPDDAEELVELEEAAGDCENREEAEQRIQEDALSVEVRSGWYTPGEGPDAPEEFQILLATGGPAVRICGGLDADGEPAHAWLEVRDWFKPWTQYSPADQDTLLNYSRCFYFGEG